MKASLKKQGDNRLEEVRVHADSMDALTKHFRSEVRQLIRFYRTSQTARQVCDIREMYFTAENTILRQHIIQVYALYREAHRDLQAMRRVLRDETRL